MTHLSASTANNSIERHARWLVSISLVLIGIFAITLFLSQPAAAGGGVVTNCSNDAELTTKLAGGGNITFNCGGPKTIVFTTQKIITQPTTIDGGGVITFSGGGLTRTFFISTSGQLVVSNLVFYNSSAISDTGGAIYTMGVLTVTHSRFISNYADYGGAMQTYAGYVFIADSQFYSNTSSSWGGAIDNDGAVVLRIVNSGFHYNKSINDGGGAMDSDSSGVVDISGSLFDHNVGMNGNGGAIWEDSQFTITNSIFAYNSVLGGDDGGALRASSSSTTTIINSEFYSNTADECCGAMLLDGVVTILNTSIYNNWTTGYNAGGFENDGVLTMASSSVYNNSALSTTAEAGGLENYGSATLINVQVYNNAAGGDASGGIENGGLLTLISTTVRNNTSGGNGGGIGSDNDGVLTVTASLIAFNQAAGNGGGLYFESGSLTMINSTVAHNSAQLGGGLFVTTSLAQPLQITNATFYSNSATSGGNFGGSISGTMQLVNTIVTLGSPNNCANSGNVTSFGHNLEFGNSCGLNAAGDLTNTNPALSPLANHGGSTWTLSPLSGSPAIDAGDNASCPADDQRGFVRPLDGDDNSSKVCDIGAVEAGLNLYLPLVLKNF
jgi:hypothetical protein